MTLDFVVRLTIHDYRTGPDGQFMLPYSCLLRPALVVVQSAALRNVIAHFALTLAKSRDVFVLALSFMVVGAIGSMLLLQGRLEDQHEFGRGFDGTCAARRRVRRAAHVRTATTKAKAPCRCHTAEYDASGV